MSRTYREHARQADHLQFFYEGRAEGKPTYLVVLAQPNPGSLEPPIRLGRIYTTWPTAFSLNPGRWFTWAVPGVAYDSMRDAGAALLESSRMAPELSEEVVS